MMAEKIRAIMGQRIYAVSRDLYDIFCLGRFVDDRKVLDGLPAKLAVRGVDVEAFESKRVTTRKVEFRADWDRNLANLLPPGDDAEFDEVWDSVVRYIQGMAEGLEQARKGAQ